MSRWQNYFQDKRVWITGASSGIGAAMVRALGSAGIATLASARRIDRLDEIAASYPSVQTLALDISELDGISETVTRGWDLLGCIDVLINNAGVSQRSLFAETDPEVLERILQVNMTGPMRLTREVLSRMLTQGAGHLVSVTSYAAFVPTPLRTVYTAAKMGLHGLFDALRAEVGPSGITVTLVVPGFVRTEISTNSLDAAGNPRGVMDSNQATGMSPEDAADRILTGIARRRQQFVVATTPRLRFARLLRTLIPRVFWRILERADVK